MSKSDEREKELDAYEAQYGKYVRENGAFGMPSLVIENQQFALHWQYDQYYSETSNAEHKQWFTRMLCCALHHLVEAEAKNIKQEQK